MGGLIVRLALSIVGGVAIPFIYGYLFASIAAYFGRELLIRIFRVPILWPTLIYEYFYPSSADHPSDGWLIALYLGNFLLYSALTYALLSWQSTRKRLP